MGPCNPFIFIPEAVMDAKGPSLDFEIYTP